jgi:hypothetical protein
MNSHATRTSGDAQARISEPLPDWLRLVREQVESLKFGTVLVTVHDSKVVQIERNEKTRLERFH